MAEIVYRPIGVLHTPFTATAGMPLQAVAATGIAGTIALDPQYAEGLADLAAFSHLILLYHLHRVQRAVLTVTPFLDDRPHGIFATRSPARPNAIGLSVVRLEGMEGCTLTITDVDMVDGTPLLDIKPYIPAFDAHATDQIGWFAGRVERVREVRADDRFR